MQVNSKYLIGGAVLTALVVGGIGFSMSHSNSSKPNPASESATSTSKAMEDKNSITSSIDNNIKSASSSSSVTASSASANKTSATADKKATDMTKKDGKSNVDQLKPAIETFFNTMFQYNYSKVSDTSRANIMAGVSNMQLVHKVMPGTWTTDESIKSLPMTFTSRVTSPIVIAPDSVNPETLNVSFKYSVVGPDSEVKYATSFAVKGSDGKLTDVTQTASVNE